MSERVWLDWSGPALPAAADWLVEKGRDGSRPWLCDLENRLAVVSGRRASRLLLRGIAARCAAAGLHLVPPRLLTPAPMVDALLRLDGPLASGAEARLAWIAALRRTSAARLRPLLPARPDRDDLPGWLDLAGRFDDAVGELAGHRLEPDDVAAAAGELDLPAEAARWRALAEVRRAQQDLLRRCGLVDPHAARELALAAAAIRPAGGITLVGVIELNRLQRDALAVHADAVTALVHAPAGESASFDELGCLRPGAWVERTIDLPETSVLLADRPEDQAQAVIRAIGGLGDGRSPQDVVVGLGDATLAGPLERAGRWAGLSLHDAAGRRLGATAPWRLLAAAAATLGEGRFGHLAALVRHPDVEDWLEREETSRVEQPSLFATDWPSTLDRYAARHLPDRLEERWRGEREDVERLRVLRGLVDDLLRPIAAARATADPGPTRARLDTWCDAALRLLGAVYGDRPADGGDDAVDGCVALAASMRELGSAHPALQPDVTAAEGLGLLLAAAEAHAVPADPGREQIEMLGWLELHLDPAPALVVAGVNDGAVPRRAGADALLPDGLRRHLGLLDAAGRYARDAYLLEAIRHSREDLLLIAGRRSDDGDLLTPSRLLLACGRERLPGRVGSLCDERHAASWTLPLGAPPPAPRSSFLVPALPENLAQPSSMSATRFRDYLRCPYRFALRHLVRLESLTDDAREMDALQFGTLAHDVLRDFGREPALRDSAEAPAIAAFLVDRLARLARARFGPRPAPAVAVQITRLRRRLEGFALFQAAHRRAGWRIDRAEHELPPHASLDPGEGLRPMRIRGRIDRVDRHETTGGWLVIDYKTAEDRHTPEQVHHGARKPRPDRWLDVQLPLYWHLLRETGNLEGPLDLAYVVLPRDPEAVALAKATWTEPQLRRGVDAARAVVRDVRRGRFERNANMGGGWDEFARICQTAAFGFEGDGTGEDESPGEDDPA